MRMLVATGGARHSTFALWVAEQLATPTTEITILCVAPSANEASRAESVVEEARCHWLPDHTQTTARVRIGKAALEIVKEAELSGYDLVILGERSPHRLRARVLGSVVSHVTAHAPCPVLIAKGVRRPNERILICDSGSGRPSVINLFGRYDWACQWARETDVTLLHIMSQITAAPGVRDKQLQADTQGLIASHTLEGNLLTRDIAWLKDHGVIAVAKVRHGLVLEEILAEADAGDYGLLVIGAHHRSGWQDYLLTNLAQQIINRSTRSVLLLR